MDWAYDLNSDSGEWNQKGFSESRDDLYFLDEAEDIIKELHITWTPGNWNIRLGKQILSWGEMDGMRITDQINPLDSRRGFTDVKFETTILPIWMAKAEYYVPMETSWLWDLGLEFFFNPNLYFQTDLGLDYGNDKGGIWAPGHLLDFGDGFYAHLGSSVENIEKRSGWDGTEWGIRLKGNFSNSLITLIYFNGISNSPMPLADYAASDAAFLADMDFSAWDGLPTYHIYYNGEYHRQKYVGATLTRDLDQLYLSSLGGYSPVLRVEVAYFFDNVYSDFDELTLVETDELLWGIGCDWKVDIPFLNPMSGINISPQFFHRKIFDYPERGLSWYSKEDNYKVDVYIETQYLRSKLAPFIYWTRDLTTEDDFYMLGFNYTYDDSWSFGIGYVGVETVKDSLAGTGYGMETFKNKDHAYFTVTYQF